MSKYNIDAAGAATPVAEAPTVFNNLTSGVMDVVTGNEDVAYGGKDLRHVGLACAGLGAVAGSMLTRRRIVTAVESGKAIPQAYLKIIG